MTGRTSASADAASWSHASGPARPFPNTADRATVVREALTSAGINAPELDRMAASMTLPDGSPRFVWTDTQPDPATYARVILASIVERQRWRTRYEAAKACRVSVDSLSATDRPP